MYIFKYILKISQPWELPTKNHHKTRPSGRPKPGRCLWSSTNPRFLEHIASSLMQSFWFASSTTQSRASRRNLASLKKTRKTEGNDLVHWFFVWLDFVIHPSIPWNYKGNKAVILLFLNWLYVHIGLDTAQFVQSWIAIIPTSKKYHTVWKQSQMTIIGVRSIACWRYIYGISCPHP